MTAIRTRKSRSHRNAVRMHHKQWATVAALALTNGVSFDEQLMTLLRTGMGK